MNVLPLGCFGTTDRREALPGRRSVGLRIRVIVVRLPERRQVPAEVRFEVARKTVTELPTLARRACAPGKARVEKNMSVLD
jgi:hypothetical protein